MRIVTYAITALVIVGVLIFMVWGDNGPFWKNISAQALVCASVALVFGAIIWVSTYGT